MGVFEDHAKPTEVLTVIQSMHATINPLLYISEVPHIKEMTFGSARHIQ